MREDVELLRSYAGNGSEDAFAELVQRHIDFVYSVAMRQLGGDAHLAKDVAQRVFTDVARKAALLADRPSLTGWLYRAAQFAASDVVRSERRRRAREQEACIMQETAFGADEASKWDELRPALDQMMGRLSERDRDAVMLRFFEGRSFAEIGARVQLTEDAARVRVARALEKLRGLLARRGLTSSAAALATLLAGTAGVAAPAGLAATVTSGALTGAAAGAGGALAMWGIFGVMNTTKIAAGAAGLAAVVAIGTAVYQTDASREHRAAFEAAQQQLHALQAQLSASEHRARAAEAQARLAESDSAELLGAVDSLLETTSPASKPEQTTFTADDVMRRYRRGQELVRQRSWPQALEDLLWCFDHGNRFHPNFRSVRVSFLLGEITRLGESYSPALDALRQRRDAALERVRENPSDREAAADFASINRYLKEDDHTLAFHDQLPAGDPRRRLLGLPVLEALIDRRRYDDALDFRPYDSMVRSFELSVQPRPTTVGNPEEMAAAHRRYVVSTTTKNVEVLAGAGELERARELAQKLLAYDSSLETRTVLQRHLERAGHPEILNTLPAAP